MSIEIIKGTNECFNCGATIRWETEKFNGNPSGIVRGFNAELKAESVFVAEKKIEIEIKCKKCYNINKFTKKL
jgi:hypothetical protein